MTAGLRPATAADLDAVVSLALAEEVAWFGAAESSPAEVVEYLDHHGGVAAGEVVELDGQLRGFVLVAPSTEALLFVDPSDPHPPYAPLAARVLERGASQLEFSSTDAGRAAWFEAHGWSHVRSSFDLSRPGAGAVEVASWPPEVEVTAYQRGADDAAVHELVYVDAAYAQVPGHRHRDLPTWRQMFGPECRGWVARCEGRPVGWVIGEELDDGRGWVNQIAVAGSHQRQGLGRALLLHACADLLAAGASSLGLTVQAANATAIGLYRSVGFEVDKEWRVYQFG